MTRILLLPLQRVLMDVTFPVRALGTQFANARNGKRFGLENH
jgi:hypothetical protein